MTTFFICQKEFDIIGCWDKETPENEFDFYDIYDKDGNCLNEGIPFDEFPTWLEVKEFLDSKDYFN